MPKHEPLTTTLKDCINRIDERDQQPWYDIMGITIPGHIEAIADARFSESHGDYDIAEKQWSKADVIEADYIQQHGDDPITVVWPEHVLVPRFNSDASYQ